MFKIVIIFLFLYFIFSMYVFITEYIEMKNSGNTSYEPELFEGEERYVFSRQLFDGSVEYWDRKENKYVIY